MFAYGVKPYELQRYSVIDVLDIIIGLEDRKKSDVKLWYRIAEFVGKIASGKYRVPADMSNGISPGVKELIRQQDEIDRAKGILV